MLLVDAYNVLMAPGVLPPRLAGLELEELIVLIARSRYGGRSVRMVCDGVPAGVRGDEWGWGETSPGAGSVRRTVSGAEVVYAGPGREADDEIERVLATDSGARRMLVVSTDRRVRKAAKRARAGSIEAGDFLAHLVADEAVRPMERRARYPSPIPLRDAEIGFWMRQFGVTGAEIPDEPTRPAAAARVEVPDAGGAGAAVRRPTAAARLVAREGRPRGPRVGEVPVTAPGPVDPLLLEALRHWEGRLRLEDLDMTRWLSERADAGGRGDDGSRPAR